MQKESISKIDKMRVLFFSYSLSLIDILLCQPFHENVRFIIYLTIPFFAIYIIFKLGIKPLILNVASILILMTELFNGVLLFINKDVMTFGLAAIIDLVIFFIGFYAISSDDLFNEINFVTKVLTIVTFIICIISYLIRPIMLAFPELNDLYVGNHLFTFSGIADSDYRWKGYARHPNSTGIICEVGIISSFILFMYSKNKKELALSVINMCLNGLFLILVSSRSPLLSTGTFVIAFLLYYGLVGGFKNNKVIKKRLFFLIGISLLVICLLCVCLIFSPAFRDYLINKIIRVDNIKTATGRTNLQKTIMTEFWKQKHYFKGLSYNYINEITNGFGPHNTFIQTIAANGIPSLILLIISLAVPFVFLIIFIFKRSELTQTELFIASISFGSFIAMIIQNSFECAYVWQMCGNAGFERWLLCFPIIIWYNKHNCINKN